MLTNVVLGLALVVFATAVPHDTPSVASENDNLKLAVSRDKDIVFTRERRDETVSIWSVNDRLAALEGAGDKKLRELEAKIIEKISKNQQETQAQIDKKMEQFEGKLEAMRKSLQDSLTDQFKRSMDTVATSLVSSTQAVQSSLNDRVKAVDSKLDGFKDLINDAVSKATDSIKKDVHSALTSGEELKKSLNAKVDSLDSSITKTVSDNEKAIAAASKSNNDKLAKATSTLQATVDNKLKAAEAKTSLALKPVANLAAKTNLPWKMCTWGAANNGCNNCQIFRCDFKKSRDDTVLHLFMSTNQRLVGNGHASRWFFRVDGQDCRTDKGSSKGHIDTRFHASQSVNLHRNNHLEGICFRHRGGVIKAGIRRISYHVEGNGNPYTGWDSNSRMMIKEIFAPEHQTF